MSEKNIWEQDLEKIEGGTETDFKNMKEEKPKTYFGIKIFTLISIFLGAIIKPITLLWTIPMSLYVLFKVEFGKNINWFVRILSWFLISPAIGGMLISYKGKNASCEKTKEIENNTMNINTQETLEEQNNTSNIVPLTINEKSLVKVEQIRCFSSSLAFSFGESWIVFSNIYLENSNCFPDLNTIKFTRDEFSEYYRMVTDIQKEILPIPKKHLNIAEGDLYFYYPCSEAFNELKGKKEGDIVRIRGGDVFKILEIINP